MAYERRERFANPNPKMGDGFFNPNRRARFPYPNHDREGLNEYKMKVEILFLVRTLILNPS